MYNNFFSDRTYIIAEIGGNFKNLDEAKKLIDFAKKSGVDAIKIQTYRAETIASKKAMFDMENTGKVSQYEIFKKYEVDFDLHKKIAQYSKIQNLEFFSTPSHETDVDMLENLNVNIHKIGSDDAVNLPFLKYVAKTNKIIILSTGMCTLDEVRESVETIKSQNNNKIVLLHCTSCYPTHPKDANINAIKTMINSFPEIPIGYSDHTLDTNASCLAVAIGAKVIEKHFTFDKKADGPDHMLSSDLDEMSELVKRIRIIEKLKGNEEKKPADGEKTNLINNRKSIIINAALPKGSILKKDNLSIKRPGSGIYPKFIDEVIGKKLLKSVEEDHILEWNDLE